MVEQVFLAPQVKQSVIISNKDVTYELPRGLPNDLRIWILENYEISEKSKNFIELLPGPCPSPKM